MNKEKVKEVLSLQRCCIAAFRATLSTVCKEEPGVTKTLERVEKMYHAVMSDIDSSDVDTCIGCTSLSFGGFITDCDTCTRSGSVKDKYTK